MRISSRAITDAAGEATLKFPPGDHEVYVQPPGYSIWRRPADQKTLYTIHRGLVTVPKTPGDTPLVIRLQPCCTMHAEVVDAGTGKPIANARLLITVRTPMPGGRGTLVEQVEGARGGPSDQTDAQGRADVAMPADRPFTLDVAGYERFVSTDPVELPAGKEVKLRFELRKKP